MKGKIILKAILCLAAVVTFFSLGSCGDKKFELKLPLALNAHTLNFNEEGGDDHIFVYCTGDWTVGFDREIDWGSLDRRSGHGNGEFVFSFSTNYELSRKVIIRVASGSLRDSIVILQSGPMSSATVTFSESSIAVADTSATISIGYSTSLLYATSNLKSRTAYYNEDGTADAGAEPWISNVVVSERTVSFDVDRNKKDAYRNADLTVYMEDADDNEYGATLSVTQIPAGMAY